MRTSWQRVHERRTLRTGHFRLPGRRCSPILIPLSLAFWSVVVYLLFGRGNAAAAFRSGAPVIGAAIAMVSLLASTCVHGSYEVRVELFIGGPYAYTVETIERSFAGLLLGLGLITLALAAERFVLTVKSEARIGH